MQPRSIVVDCTSPDPTNAILGFLRNMAKARELGFTVPNKWAIAEHFFRDDVSLVFYGTGGETIILGADEVALDDEGSWEFVKLLMTRVTERRKAKKAEEEIPVIAAAIGEEPQPVMPRQRGGVVRAKQMKEAQGADV